VKLAELLPTVVATGHGIPLYGEQMRRELLRLGYEFETRGLPASGRYRDIPVLFEPEAGLMRVPPPKVGAWQVLAGVVGVGIVLGALIGKRRR
jgi:hypothetical protein